MRMERSLGFHQHRPIATTFGYTISGNTVPLTEKKSAKMYFRDLLKQDLLELKSTTIKYHYEKYSINSCFVCSILI
jgi:uncharacterized protein (UPF0297 family)